MACGRGVRAAGDPSLTARGNEPPQAGQENRQQHRILASIRPRARRSRAGIPYRCFEVSACSAPWRVMASIWLAICARSMTVASTCWPLAGVNSTPSQINHLRRCASETHYRGPHSPLQAAEVKTVEVDEESAGQRLDNFLIRQLKGVPKTHVYRIIRSGEVRVNRGRAEADTRVAAGDVVRVPPVRMSERLADKARAAGAAARISGAARRRAPGGHRQAGRRGGARRQRRELRRDRAAAPGAAGRRSSSSWSTGSTARPRASCWWPRSAGRSLRLQDQFRDARPARPTWRWSRRLARQQEGHRPAAGQEPAGRRRAPREAWWPRTIRRHARDHAVGCRRAQAGRLQAPHAARSHHQDRPHPPDPRAPGVAGPPDRRRRQVRRLRAQQACRSTASSACSCMPGGYSSSIPPPASPSRCRPRCRRPQKIHAHDACPTSPPL